MFKFYIVIPCSHKIHEHGICHGIESYKYNKCNEYILVGKSFSVCIYSGHTKIKIDMQLLVYCVC